MKMQIIVEIIIIKTIIEKNKYVHQLCDGCLSHRYDKRGMFLCTKIMKGKE
jgi:hypothetical protein